MDFSHTRNEGRPAIGELSYCYIQTSDHVVPKTLEHSVGPPTQVWPKHTEWETFKYSFFTVLASRACPKTCAGNTEHVRAHSEKQKKGPSCLLPPVFQKSPIGKGPQNYFYFVFIIGFIYQ